MIIINRDGYLVESLNDGREVAILFNQCRLKVSNDVVNNLLSLTKYDGSLPTFDMNSTLELIRDIAVSGDMNSKCFDLEDIGTVTGDKEYKACLVKAGYKTNERAWLMFLCDNSGRVTFYVLGCTTGFTQYTWKLKESIGELFYHNKEYFLTGGVEDV